MDKLVHNSNIEKHSYVVKMFKREKLINGNNYTYLEHSFRVGDSVKKVSFYVSKTGNLKDFDILNKDSLKKVVECRFGYIKKEQKYSKFFKYSNQIRKIEEKKVQFQVLSKLLNKEQKKEILNEFLRTFLVNSMAMEGGTISYDIAKAIDEKKKFRFKNINELDVPLYLQLKDTYSKLQKIQLRYPKQIRDLHKMIYNNIYHFAGKFRDKKVTFGDITNLAVTSEPVEVINDYRNALKNFYKNKGKMYDFERVIEFHKDFQRVHGFEDGNSRLGRLIMMDQFMKLGYPPPLIRGTQSKAYRLSLARAINQRNNTSLLKLFYEAYKRTFDKFWLPALEERIKADCFDRLLKKTRKFAKKKGIKPKDVEKVRGNKSQ